MNLKIIFLSFIVWIVSQGASAQQSAVEYNNAIVNEINPVSIATMSYLDAAMHEHNAADANAKLATLIKMLEKAKDNVAKMPTYKGYAGLRDSVTNYLSLGYKATKNYSGVFSEDEMVSMPYEKVKALMEASDLLNDRLTISNILIKREQKRFAEREKFSIENNDNQTDNKLQQVKQVLHYYHRAILLFFKCNKIELAFIDSMNQGNTVSLESIRANLQKYTEQSLKNFDTMSAYNNDASLIKASTEALQFFESEAKDKFPILIDYYQKKGKFDRQAAAINNTAPQDRTQKMIDSYNANLNAINEMTDKYNSTNQELNTMRMAVVNKYNKTINDFFDRNTPKLK